MAEGTILVIDDDAVIAELLRLNFEIEGYDVVTAADGRSGLAAAAEHRPAAIVLDVMMPGLTGLDVARQLRTDPVTGGTPILLLSAKAQRADVEVGLEVADDYVTKPFEPLDLLDRVGRLIAARLAAE